MIIRIIVVYWCPSSTMHRIIEVVLCSLVRISHDLISVDIMFIAWRGSVVLCARPMDWTSWRSHLSSHVLRRRIDLNTDLWNLGNVKLWRLSLCLFFFSLLFLDKVNIILSCHTLTFTCCVPRRIGYFLHLEQSIRCNFVLNSCILILSVKVLSIVLFWIHQTNVLLQLLTERLREVISFCLF